MTMGDLSRQSGLILVILLVNFCPTLRAEPRPTSLGKFYSLAHGVKSGDVRILDEKTVRITDFHYDGKGPAGWFVLGKGQDYKKERVVLKGYTVIPDENKSCDRLKKYEGKTIELVLPGKYTFKDFDYLSAYCLEYNHNFGYVTIPKDLNVPEAIPNDLKVCVTKWNSNAGRITISLSTFFLPLAAAIFSTIIF